MFGSLRVLIFCFIFGFLKSSPSHCLERPYIKGLYSLPLTLDPIKMNDTASLVAGNLIYDGLLKFSPTLKIEPAIAESWTTSPDGKVLTFKIKSNAKFHNGLSITAIDVVTSLARALSPESKVQKLYDCIDGTNGLRAINDQTIQIKLRHAFPPILSILAGATAKILPSKNINDANFFSKPVGSGAFYFDDLNTEKREITVRAFKNYYGTIPKLASIILRETNQDVATKQAALGEMHDLANWPLATNEPIFKIGKNISSPVASTWIIGINSTMPPFDKLEVRHAFKNAINAESFRLKFYPDAIPAKGYIPYGLVGSNIHITRTISKKLLIPKRKIKLVIPIELSAASDMKIFFETAMRKYGWNFDVELLPWNKLMEGYSKKSYQSFLVAMNMDYPDPEFLLKNFESNNPDNFSGIKNKKLDNFIQQSRTQQDRKIRENLYIETIKLVEDLALTVNLFHPRANYWVDNCVEGFTPNILSDVYIDYSKVSFKLNCSSRTVVTK